MPDVSVVVPTHNRLHLLPVTIDSILRQIGVSLELIVINDGSIDGTGLWLDQLSMREPRITVVHHERPRFISSARNAGLARASARWVGFCDDDDLWAPDKLARQLKALQMSLANWSCTGIIVVDEALEIIGHHHVRAEDILPRLLENNVIPTGSSVIADRRLLQMLGGFDTTLSSSEDWDLWIKLAQVSPVAAIDRPLVAYRLGMQTMSMDVPRMRTGRSTIVDRYAPLAAKYRIRPDEATHERYLARQLLRAGSGAQAASVFATLALKHRRWRELPRVAAALLAPHMTDRMGRARAKAAVPISWRAEADAWLRVIRAGDRIHLDNSAPYQCRRPEIRH